MRLSSSWLIKLTAWTIIHTVIVTIFRLCSNSTFSRFFSRSISSFLRFLWRSAISLFSLYNSSASWTRAKCLKLVNERIDDRSLIYDLLATLSMAESHHLLHHFQSKMFFGALSLDYYWYYCCININMLPAFLMYDCWTFNSMLRRTNSVCLLRDHISMVVFSY